MKVEKDTPEKPEVYRIAEYLGISQADAFLACFRVWRWADGQSEDGIIKASYAAIDDNAKVPNFHKALSEVGWLNLRTGAVELPNFVRHMGMSAKRRCVDAVRKMSARQPDKMRTREEKRREEKSKDKETPFPPLPFLSEEFTKAWADWEQHKKEKRDKLTPTAVKKQFKKLAVMGETRAIAAIEHSIANGYQGIYEPNQQHQSKAESRRTAFDAVIDNYGKQHDAR